MQTEPAKRAQFYEPFGNLFVIDPIGVKQPAVEGTFEDMLEILKVLKDKNVGYYHGTRCAVYCDSDYAEFYSPRNSEGKRWSIPTAQANRLAVEMELKLRALHEDFPDEYG